MPNPLMNVPGLAGYLSQQQMARQQEQGQLQQFGQVIGLRQALAQQEAAKQEALHTQQFRAEIEKLGPNASQDQLADVGARFTKDPSRLMDMQQKSLDRKEAMRERATQFQATLDMRQADLDRKRDEFQQKNQDAAERAKFEQWYKTESLRNQQSREALNTTLRQQGIDLQRARVEQQQGQQQGQRVQQLGTALERASLPEADAVLRGVEDALKATPDLAEYLSGPKSVLPDLVVSKEIATGRQAFQKLFNITLKNRSGAAVTIPELERLKQEFATGAWKTAAQLRAGVEQARSIIAQHYRSVAAGFGPDAMKSYNENLRQFGGTPLLEPNATPADGGTNDPLGIRK